MPDSDQPANVGKPPANVHDDLFRLVFQRIEYVITLIRTRASTALLEIIDWSTLTPVPGKIQVEHQVGRDADLMFTAAIKGVEVPVYIILLFEHKSYRDADLVLQMARNQFLMYMKSEFKSLIIPILVTQDVPVGPGGVQFLDLFSDLPESHKRVLSEYALNFRCLVIDVNELDRQGVAERTNIDAVVHAMAQVRGADVSLLPELVDRVGHVRPDDRERMLGLLIGYVCDYNTDITLEDVLSVKAKTPEGQKMAQSAVDILREQEREQVALNMLREGMDPEAIVKVTQLSPAKVEKLRRANNSG